MRYVVLIFALLGAGVCGFMGFRWMKDLQDNKAIAATNRALGDLFKKESKPMPAELAVEYDKVVGRSKTWPLMLANGFMGLFGGILAMQRRGKSAFLVLAVAVAAPAALYPVTLILTGVLGLAALLALFIRSRPKPAPVAV